MLKKAPNPEPVLRAFVNQFASGAWTGSRATEMETNAKLLDQLESEADPALVALVAKEKSRITKAIEEERRSETMNEKNRNERFE